MNTAKRHILYINADRGIPVWGDSGGSAHIRDFVEAAIRQGSKVTLVAARCKEAVGFSTVAKLHKINFRRYAAAFHNTWKQSEKSAMAKEIRSFMANTVLSQQLPNMAKENNFSLVYERYSLFNFAGRNFSKSYGLPYVLEVNAPLIDEALLHRELHMREMANSVARYLFTSADRIVAVSTEVKAYIQSVAPKAIIEVVPNAVNPDRLSKDVQSIANGLGADCSASGLLPHLTDKFVVGYLGSLKPWHGLQNLIEAFAKFAQENSSSHLLIVGDGKNVRPQLEKSCLEFGIHSQVTFVGEIPNSQVAQYLSYCDTVVAPYPASERFYFSPLKIFEYLASGKPIIASKIGQIAELLTDGETALLVEPGNVSELTLAMQQVCSDSQLARALGAKAYKLAQERHSWDVRMNQIERIFNGLESAPRSRELV